MTDTADARRRIPQVEWLVQQVEADAPDLPRAAIVDAVRAVVDSIRRRASDPEAVPASGEIVARAREELMRRRRRLLRPVINATGVLIHTNLGRAPLAPRALAAVARIGEGYSNLEWDPDTGRRGDRYDRVEPLVALATGAEAALIVNNNAAAMLLVCAALANGREVVISRGELIEIGGEFRIPEVLAASGAILHEVGTTNRTRLGDYERALGAETGLLLKVHPSNYRVVGFTEAVEAAPLARLARERGVPLVYDVGSGLLARPFADEPLVTNALTDGCDLVCFSGDKLLGGPQAGVVCGSAELVSRMRRHPLLRALRPDKLQLAALGETISLYLEGAVDELPVWRMLAASPGTLRGRAERLAEAAAGAGLTSEIVAGESVTGGGSLPGHGIPSPVVRLTHRTQAPAELAAALRAHEPPVAVRVEADSVVVDVRTVLPEHDQDLTAAVLAVAGSAPR